MAITKDLRKNYEVNNSYKEYMKNWSDKAKLKEISAGNLTRIPKTGTLRQMKHEKKLFSQFKIDSDEIVPFERVDEDWKEKYFSVNKRLDELILLLADKNKQLIDVTEQLEEKNKQFGGKKKKKKKKKKK